MTESGAQSDFEPLRRPPVSVIVPFHGSCDQATDLLGVLTGVELSSADELLVADNTDGAVVARAQKRDPRWERIRVVAAAGARTAYYARNRGAAQARHDWFLFLDADCHPVPDIVDAFFAPPPATRVGAVAGAVRGSPQQMTLAARYARSRRYLDQAVCLAHPYMPAAVTANLLVSREAFEGAGGFVDTVQSGEDWDFCWRMQEAGWSLDYRERALVYHDHRETVTGLLRQVRRDAAGRAWLKARRPGAFAAERRFLDAGRAILAAARWAAIGQTERAAFRALDALVIAANGIGERSSNRAAAPGGP